MGTRGAPAPAAAAGAGAGWADRLTDVDRRNLLARGVRRRYPRNEWVFHEGDVSDFVVVVVGGRLKIVVTTATGGESILGIRGPGAVVGELGAFDLGARTAGAVALDPVEARVIPAGEFRDFVATHPQAAVELIRMLMGRLREGDRRRSEFGSVQATVRVARLVVDLAGDGPLRADGTRQIRLAQHEIAGLVGTSRESVARALAVLRERRLVTTGRGTIVVTDAEGLRRFCG